MTGGAATGHSYLYLWPLIAPPLVNVVNTIEKCHCIRVLLDEGMWICNICAFVWVSPYKMLYICFPIVIRTLFVWICLFFSLWFKICFNLFSVRFCTWNQYRFYIESDRSLHPHCVWMLSCRCFIQIEYDLK